MSEGALSSARASNAIMVPSGDQAGIDAAIPSVGSTCTADPPSAIVAIWSIPGAPRPVTKAILVPTFTGRTASAVARLRPRRPIVALTHIDWAQRQMALEWGVTPLLIPETRDVDELWELSLSTTRDEGIVETGDTVVITAGTAVNIPGSTNVIKVEIV